MTVTGWMEQFTGDWREEENSAWEEMATPYGPATRVLTSDKLWHASPAGQKSPLHPAKDRMGHREDPFRPSPGQYRNQLSNKRKQFGLKGVLNLLAAEGCQ